MMIRSILCLLTMMLSHGWILKSPINRHVAITSISQLSSTLETSSSFSSSSANVPALTKKEHYIAVRNRLFLVQENLWLHDYAEAHPKSKKVAPLSPSKLDIHVQNQDDLHNEYPLTKLYIDLRDARWNNMTYAEMHLEKMISDGHRHLPLSLDHRNIIAEVSSNGRVMTLIRGQGLLHCPLRPSAILEDKSLTRQFQHPVFSKQGEHVAFAELQFKDSSIVRSHILIYYVPNDPETYGNYGYKPLFDSGEFPGSPFYLQFSPDGGSIAILSAPSNNNTPSIAPYYGYTPSITPLASTNKDGPIALTIMNWAKMHRDRSPAMGKDVTRFIPKKGISLLRGNSLYFTYTTSNSENATIVAHCENEISDPVSQEMVTEKAVWMLDRAGTAVNDDGWKKIAVSDPTIRWYTPICHSAGGGDNVLVVEDGYLLSKAISRWKRDMSTGELYSKKIMKVSGQVQFLVSPDHSRAVVLQEDIDVGHYSLSVIEGESSLDPASSTLPTIYEVPHQKFTVAFWFSPDSTKLLCLTAAGKTRDDVMTQKSQFRVTDMEWIVFNFPLQEWKEFGTFNPTPYFIKTYVPFFSLYASAFNPWAPDSNSFIYISTTGLIHVPLVESKQKHKYCVGKDTWESKGATIATWFRPLA